MEDDKIIGLIKTGKSDRALDVLYHHYPVIRKIIIAKGGSRQQAEDIFQEALIILLRKASHANFTLTAPLGAYITGICRLLWKAEMKKKQLTVATAYTDNSGEETAERALHQALEEEARIKLAEQALQQLKERCRELLLLFYSGTRKLSEIAQVMGYSSENTAKNQKYKCLEGAKNRLKELQQTTL